MTRKGLIHRKTKQPTNQPTNLPTPLQVGQFFRWSKADLNSEFSFSWYGGRTKAKEGSLLYYYPWPEEEQMD